MGGDRIKRSPARGTGPSELEGVVLGIVHDLQPCTAYGVRRELAESPSTIWSGSAGSIYPLIKRLVGQGWVESTPDSSDGRGRQVLRLTSDGVGVLRQWTLDGVDPEIAARMYDSLRVRVFSLSVLGPEDRIRFVNDALSVLETLLEASRRHRDERSNTEGAFESLANLGAVYEAEARVRWMREVLAALS